MKRQIKVQTTANKKRRKEIGFFRLAQQNKTKNNNSGSQIQYETSQQIENDLRARFVVSSSAIYN